MTLFRFSLVEGKKTAWDAWNIFPELTSPLESINTLAVTLEDVKTLMAVMERFVVLLYDCTSVLTEVDKARQELFMKKLRTIDAIPPSKAALE